MAVVPKHGVLQSEIKGYSPQYADMFDAAVKAAGLSETNIVVSSFQYDALRDFKSRYPKYRCVWLVELLRNRPLVPPDAGGAREARFTTLSRGVSPQFVVENPICNDHFCRCKHFLVAMAHR